MYDISLVSVVDDRVNTLVTYTNTLTNGIYFDYVFHYITKTKFMVLSLHLISMHLFYALITSTRNTTVRARGEATDIRTRRMFCITSEQKVVVRG